MSADANPYAPPGGAKVEAPSNQPIHMAYLLIATVVTSAVMTPIILLADMTSLPKPHTPFAGLAISVVVFSLIWGLGCRRRNLSNFLRTSIQLFFAGWTCQTAFLHYFRIYGLKLSGLGGLRQLEPLIYFWGASALLTVIVWAVARKRSSH